MKKLVIMAGLPASGKSTIRNKNYSNLVFVDCDEIKKSLPNYDPKNPTVAHAQSKMLEKQAIYNNLAAGISFLYDTTGTNSDNVIMLTKQAQELGYTVELVYVKVSLATSLYRNANRERVVPQEIILEKYELITSSTQVCKMFVGPYTEIEND